MNTKLWLSLAAVAAATCGASAQPYSVWLPQPKELVVTPGYVYQAFDTFWVGRDTEVELNHHVYQHTALLNLEYGVSERFALDLTGGYVWTHAQSFGDESDEGLTDTSFGARYRFLDEETIGLAWVPSLAVRIGGNIEGTYDQNLPFSAGDGASGAEASLLLGKALCPHAGLFGDIGYRYRNHDVPDDLFGSIGVYGTWQRLTLHVGYRHTQGLSGDDIGDPGFTFPGLKEINQNVEVGLGFADSGNRYYQLFYARTIDGRNTGEKDIIGVAFSYPF